MRPLTIVALIFWSGVLSTAVCFALDKPLHQLLRRYWKTAFVLVLLTLLWRGASTGTRDPSDRAHCIAPTVCKGIRTDLYQFTLSILPQC